MISYLLIVGEPPLTVSQREGKTRRNVTCVQLVKSVKKIRLFDSRGRHDKTRHQQRMKITDNYANTAIVAALRRKNNMLNILVYI